MSTDVLSENKPWVFLAPASNVELTEESGLMFRIDRTRLVSRRSLPHRWQQLGLPARISELRTGHGGFLDRFFADVETFAVARAEGVGREVRDQLQAIVRDELSILAATQLGFAKRHSIAVPAMTAKRRLPSESYLLVASEHVAWSQKDRTVGPFQNLVLERRWLDFQKDVAFDELLAALRGGRSVSTGWRRDLRNAVVLVGQSQCTLDIPQAFLWNMIALELLLTKRGDPTKDALPTRAEAFLGWVTDWHADDYETRIRDLYKKRCLFVHQGRREAITLRDVYFTDDLILNLLSNISRHLDLFRSKDDIMTFSKRLEAERTLGVEAQVRPRTLTFIRRFYQDRDSDRT